MNDVLKKQLREAIEAAQLEVDAAWTHAHEHGTPEVFCGKWSMIMDLLVDIEGACDELCAVVPND